jgi:hypothetical protein
MTSADPAPEGWLAHRGCAGKPWPSDSQGLDERLAQMKRVLFDAATRHQSLRFTGHPATWRDLGVGARSLETLRAAG